MVYSMHVAPTILLEIFSQNIFKELLLCYVKDFSLVHENDNRQGKARQSKSKNKFLHLTSGWSPMVADDMLMNHLFREL